MKKPELEPFLTDIIWGVVVAAIMGVLFYNTVYPPAYKECKAYAIETDSSFSYSTIKGCKIFKETND